MTEPEPLQQVDRTWVLYQGRKLSYFSGCDYFRLASHPALRQAASKALKSIGLNVAASRMTTGNHEIYRELECRLAKFFASEAALLLPSGYMTSSVAAQSLAGKFSLALLDEKSHPALRDAALQLDCPIKHFKHRSPLDLAKITSRLSESTRPILLTDGMFSHDGSAAPLKEYVRMLPRNAMILVDDAHGAGVLGRTGKGTLEFEGVNRDRVIQCVTLSKAFGAYGGAILGSRALRKDIVARSRMFLGTTPLPLPLAAAGIAAVEILKSDRSFLRRLKTKAAEFKTALRDSGFGIPETPGPIVPIRLANARANNRLKRQLLETGIYPPFINYHSGSDDGYFRFVLSSEHSKEQLDNALGVIKAQTQRGKAATKVVARASRPCVSVLR